MSYSNMYRSWLSSIIVAVLGFALPAFCAKQDDDIRVLANRVNELGLEALAINKAHMQTHAAMFSTSKELANASAATKRKQAELERKLLSLEVRIIQLESSVK